MNIKGIPGKLGTKINAILLLFFVMALTTIIATLYVGRQLEGGAGAINEAGAQRMRVYRMVYLMETSVREPMRSTEILGQVRDTFRTFESALELLAVGDVDRPLFLPREPEVQREFSQVRQQWELQLRPAAQHAMDAQDANSRMQALLPLRAQVGEFVDSVNNLVLLIEKSNARYTDWMWIYQNALVGMAMAGTLFLILVLHILVIAPVARLRKGMENMAAARFDERLPVETGDEFGDLSKGFNTMADQLANLYATLEQRVADKTRDIEGRNRELAVLYDIAAYLAEPAELPSVCRGVLGKLCNLLGAESGAVRMVNAKTQELDLIASVNLSERFLSCEAKLGLGTCLCGEGAVKGESVVNFVPHRQDLLPHCYREGVNSMVAIPVKKRNHNLGQFNLFFVGQRLLTADEVKLLEAVGRHLAVTIENRRLAVRETDMAVSEERNLLAQELHDSIAQSLAFLNIQAQMLQGSLQKGQTVTAQEELARMREGIQESYDTVRELLVHFRIQVQHADLEAAVRSALDKFESHTGIPTTLTKEGEGTISEASRILQVLHILQEALSNIRKHAHASAVDVVMRCDGKDLHIEVHDNGKGFVPEQVVEVDGSHVGIGIMRARAKRIGASVEFQTEPGKGTCVTLELLHA